MKSVQIKEFGGVEGLSLANGPKPAYKENELLVRVYACGLNPVDYKIRAGRLKDLFPIEFPHVLGGDISGVVTRVGSRVVKFKVGDEVFFSSPLNRNGGYAEFCTVEEDLAVLKPQSVSHLEAASLPVAGLTAIQALRDFSSLRSGHKVLIHAGAGGVGSFAIQYAKLCGAQVFTTARQASFEYVKSLGADVVIDYTKENFVDVCRGVGGMDVVLESLGGQSYLKSIHATRDGGCVPCIVNPPERDVLLQSSLRKIKTDFFLLQSNQKDLGEISDLVTQQKIKPGLITKIDFTSLKWAHTQLESHRVRGKLVLEI